MMHLYQTIGLWLVVLTLVVNGGHTVGTTVKDGVETAARVGGLIALCIYGYGLFTVLSILL